MHIVQEISAVRTRVAGWRQEGSSVALVPTMGALHAGHLSLVERALALSDRVIVSLFVNPMQFGPNEDFDRYPRTLAADRESLEQHGVHLLFAPTDGVIYPRGRDRQTKVHVPGLADMLCGASRPGFFDGVATVVVKLLNIVQPDVAVFGEKDYQQLTLIRQLVADLNLPVKVHSSPTKREADGLAMSSRNAYLNPGERAIAPMLHRTLVQAAESLQAHKTAAQVEHEGLSALRGAGFRPDYFSVCHATTLAPPSVEDTELVILAAAYLGFTRLIDNLRVDVSRT